MLCRADPALTFVGSRMCVLLAPAFHPSKVIVPYAYSLPDISVAPFPLCSNSDRNNDTVILVLFLRYMFTNTSVFNSLLVPSRPSRTFTSSKFPHAPPVGLECVPLHSTEY